MKRLFLLAVLACICAGCSKRTKATPMPESEYKAAKSVSEPIKTDFSFADIKTYQQPDMQKPDNMTVLFEFSQYDLKTEDALNLDAVAEYAILNNCRIEIHGGCCPIGSDDYNMGLGTARADAVKEYLMSRNVPGLMIDAWSYGENNLITSERLMYWQNRRAEVSVK